MITVTPYVPTYIRVHLGSPSSDASTVTVSFPEYIKNVASSEIYPTWSESAIYANIYAQISYALNKIYTEFYPSRGYDFDITNSTAVDQKFIYGRNIFSNIDKIVDNIFNDYIRRVGTAEPLAAKYCDGRNVTCNGLSQWGSQDLARQGYSAFGILQYYYGYDTEIVNNAPVSAARRSYPGYSISRGDTGNYVQIIQTELNQISNHYPSINKLYPIDGIFGSATENSVRQFQRIFNLTDDGIVGKATWYKLVYAYVGNLRLNELNSEGQRLFGENLSYPDAISLSDTGEKVSNLQFFLSVISSADATIPPVVIDGVFGEKTLEAVKAFQSEYGLEVTGVVDSVTWDEIYDEFKGTSIAVYGREVFEIHGEPYPGTPLKEGDSGDDVLRIQQQLNAISNENPDVSAVTPDGVFGSATLNAVKEFQQYYGLEADGIIGRQTWGAIQQTYLSLFAAVNTHPMQFGGNTLKIGDKDSVEERGEN